MVLMDHSKSYSDCPGLLDRIIQDLIQKVGLSRITGSRIIPNHWSARIILYQFGWDHPKKVGDWIIQDLIQKVAGSSRRDWIGFFLIHCGVGSDHPKGWKILDLDLIQKVGLSRIIGSSQIIGLFKTRTTLLTQKRSPRILTLARRMHDVGNPSVRPQNT